MKVIIGGVSQPMLDGTSVNITRAMSDPVPTCKLALKDNNSSIFPQAMQELLIIDDQMIPNPTVNMLLNPSLNPYTTSWFQGSPVTGITLSTVGGGGIQYTFSNAANGANQYEYQYLPTGAIVPGQTYTFSFNVIGASPVNLTIAGYIKTVDAGNNLLTQFNFSFAVPTTLTRYSTSFTAPAGTSFADVVFTAQTTSTTNSGTVTFTQVQLEPNWLPTLSYPTPWCGPAQTNCQQLPNGLWIRQYRKFAGFVNHVTYDSYHGNVRTVNIDAAGYSWLMSLVLCNNSYTNQTDSAIIANLLSTYFPGMFTTTNVLTGITLSNLVSNWDDIRTLFDGLAAQIGYYWTVDYYWSVIYAPPGYFSMPISLICDNSSNPDMVATFPAYNFSAEMDYTQPGSTALVIGSGTNVAKVIDPSTTAQNGINAGYSFQAGSLFQRKVNDSTLQSVNDCTQRGMAELLQYDYPRYLYHLTTNVELVPGQSIQVTSNTDNLFQDTQLIQQVSATWIGTSEMLTDTWEYQADLGAVNRNVAHIISRIHRITQRNTSAPAISTTTLAVIEQIGLIDSLPSTYAQVILADSPLAYYRLGEPSGTTSYDWSGNTYNGTLNGTVTPGQPGAIYNDPNTSMLFDGSTGYITLPTATNGNGKTALTVEMWTNLSTSSLGATTTLIASGSTIGLNVGYSLFWNGTSQLRCALGNGTTHTTVSVTTSPVASVWQHVVMTWDGSNLILFINGVQRSNLSFTGPISASSGTVIGASTSLSTNFPGLIDEVAVYSYALSSTQITNHYKTGKGIK